MSSRSAQPSSAPSLDQLDEAVYSDLKRIASRLSRRLPSATLGTTGLLHESWMKLRKAARLDIGSREHFTALVIKAVREATTDAARKRMARKRAWGVPSDLLPDELPARQAEADVTLAVHQALLSLEQVDARAARVVEARYFARMTSQETADAFGLSVSTVERALAVGKAWIGRCLGDREGGRGE